MSTRVVERVDDWDESPFRGGYGELREMADREFSGVVRAGGAELYMTNGSVVGIRRGSIEDFEESEGTTYTAPAAALPMLAVMQERSEEVRAEYYSEETSISEVNKTLEDGGFSGFIELSENVLSGDYYIVYHGGHSMSVAFVGSSARLIDGDEAFEKADGEVGIYEVRPVEVDPIEIPEPAEPADSAAAAAGASGTDGDDAGDDPEATDEDDDGESTAGDDSAGSADPEGSTATEGTQADESDAAPAEAAAGTDPATQEATPEEETADGVETGAQPRETTADASAAEEPRGEPDQPRSNAPGEAGGRRAGGGAATTDPQAGQARPPDGTGSAGQQPPREASGQPRTDQNQSAGTGGQQSARRGPTEEGGRHLETRAIPSLDPERSQTADPSPEESNARADAPRQPGERPDGRREPQSREPRQSPSDAGRSESRADPGRRAESEPEASPAPEPRESEARADATEPAATERVEELQAQLQDREDEIDRLEGELEAATEEKERLEEELEELRAERDELAAEVDRLETELEGLEAEFGAATDTEHRLTPAEALDGTDIFVRYESKGDTTLEKAHDSGTRRSDIADNLRLEKHTQFDAASVSVGGQAYGEFLEATVEYQFVRWVVMDLLFEIRDTGHDEALRTLYDALPQIDRAELNGEIEVVYTEDGQETRSTEAFDIVMRDRMGEPLLVANLNDSREAATESMMENLITAAERVGRTSEDFASAFFVTRSFFEPGALETASEATRSGILSRSKRKSFVNLSRKRGYHLCLVEARNENFHLAVPEL